VLAPAHERACVAGLADRLLRDTPRRFQLVLGARRIGKTTVMYQIVRRLLRSGIPASRLWWFRLDHPLLLQADLGSLIRIAQERANAAPEAPVFVLLDEVTYATDWDLWLKTFYDERWPVRVVATSSAVAALRNRRQESGIGRWEEQFLHPYTFHEYLGLIAAPVNLARHYPTP
jgi:hypothetical protein